MLEKLLVESHYDETETKFLVEGFKQGFRIGYEGNRKVKQTSQNLRFTIGSKIDLWNKVMKEVELKRYAGPFEKIPYEYYIQFPIGLVPKDGGKSTRLIFHLSHPRKPRGKEISVNAGTPKWKTSVKYPDFSEAVILCLENGKGCLLGKSDLKSAFRHFGLHPDDWMLMLMKAENPKNGKTYYFIDKCMPFGAAISCSHFQRFSNALAHITKFKTGKNTLNYLDDFFFVAVLKLLCNKQIDIFTKICDIIAFPWAKEKTFI